MKKYLCFDIGGTSIKYAVLNENYEFYSKGKVNTPLYLPEFLAAAEDIYTKEKNKHEEISAIAVSVPGKVKYGHILEGGCVSYLKDFDLKKHFYDYCGLEVTIENDGICAALAELESGVLKNCKDAVLAVFGTGIAGAVIMDGKVRRGINNSCGEFSYIIMGAGFENEETLWSSDNGDYNLRYLVSEIKKLPMESLDGEKIFEMANKGDESVNIVIENYTRLIARNLYNLQAVLDVEKIALGGGISSQKLFIDGIKNAITEYSDMLGPAVAIPQIEACKYKGEANIVGALAACLNNY